MLQRELPQVSVRRASERLTLWLILPGFMTVLAIIGGPMCYSLWLSLNRQNILTKKSQFVGLQNYADVLTDPAFLDAAIRTSVFRCSGRCWGHVARLGNGACSPPEIPG